MTAVMSPAHDDHAQIWINGEKWYNNTRWTGAARTILHDVEIDLQKGANVLLYRCGESGGSAYFNLHLDDATNDAVTVYPKDSTDQASFFAEIEPLVVSVETRWEVDDNLGGHQTPIRSVAIFVGALSQRAFFLFSDTPLHLLANHKSICYNKTMINKMRCCSFIAAFVIVLSGWIGGWTPRHESWERGVCAWKLQRGTSRFSTGNP